MFDDYCKTFLGITADEEALRTAKVLHDMDFTKFGAIVPAPLNPQHIPTSNHNDYAVCNSSMVVPTVETDPRAGTFDSPVRKRRDREIFNATETQQTGVTEGERR